MAVGGDVPLSIFYHNHLMQTIFFLAQAATTEDTESLPLLPVALVGIILLALLTRGLRFGGKTKQQNAADEEDDGSYYLLERDDRWEEEGYWDPEE